VVGVGEVRRRARRQNEEATGRVSGSPDAQGVEEILDRVPPDP
jgi:hypothetical protein